ncbi:T9SS type A sorting domain-containing protein [Weeksellaceae bacterium TAE3-ERU29]|nr:T9SS type A sorting domain-containing protein [Weeksellaceae bacterium TAE3-ERU29]
MKKIYISIIFITICSLSFSQEYWQAVNNSNKSFNSKEYILDLLTFRKQINNSNQISIPNLDGDLEYYKIVENSNFSPELSKKYPNIKSYIGYSENGELRLSVSPEKIEGIILEKNGKINTLEKVNRFYNTYEIKPKETNSKLICLTKNDRELLTNFSKYPQKTDNKLRTYRTAISVTGEYTQYHGGTKEKALAAINASLTRVNAILEKELSVHLSLIGNNDEIIFIDPDKDPYSDSKTGSEGAWSYEVQKVLSTIIGEENYDLGHLLSAKGDGGYSGGIGTVCKNGKKGSGFSSPYDSKPEGAAFDIDYLTHEMTHQLGATHIFSKDEDTGTNVEPGSGSTIMGYAGIVDTDGGIYNVQKNSDSYFNQVNIIQVNNTLKNKNCGKTTNVPNSLPNANAGADYIIPAKTPFTLKGNIDGDKKDNYFYTWEQLDSSKKDEFSLTDPTDIKGPLFRSLPPSKNTERTFPKIENLLNHNYYSKFESLPKIARELNFGFIVRNGEKYGQSSTDRMKIKVLDSETGFSVTTPQAFQSVNPNEDLMVKWNITGTDKAPINVSKVNIYLTEDGINYTLLKENTDNDGSEFVTLPKDYLSKKAYIKIEAVNNIFFALSNRISIGYKENNICKSYNPIKSLPADIPDGESTSSYKYGNPLRLNFEVAEEGNINSVSLNLGLNHTNSSDLLIYLQSPRGEIVNIFSHNCNKENIDALIDDKAENLNCSNSSQSDFKPIESFTKFSNTNQKGIWSLFIKDRQKIDTGKVNSAKLNICSSTYEPYNLPIKKDKVRVYPNPVSTSEKLNIDVLDLKSPGVSFKIYNLAGQLVRLQENLISTKSFTQKISLTGISKGIYILKVEGNSIDFSTKLIIQ